MIVGELKTIAQDYFQGLQTRLCASLEGLEAKGSFQAQPWEKSGELNGWGKMCTLQGETFEKAGVNYSQVTGSFSPEFRKQIPGAEADGSFSATGISVVIHPNSPFIPTTHMNLRLISTSKTWFGGGADLTPYYPFEEDTAFFHERLKKACDTYKEEAYPEFSAWCDRYFYLPHRKETRGVGGIFFDNVAAGTAELDFVQQAGEAFLEAYTTIVKRRLNLKWTEAEKEHQLIRRGRYVEFNLLYDRGTHFGLKTGGFTEAILMSMPPEAKWPVESLPVTK